jgi:hypothetical protein
MNQQSLQFTAGCGVIRSKVTKDAVMYFGKVSLPEHGQCFVRGHRNRDARKIDLELQSAETREVVATLSLPVSLDEVREGKVKVGRKSYLVRATLRSGVNGKYLVLRLPEVKATSAEFV